MDQFKRIGPFFLSLMFPKTCVSCRGEGSHFCQDCLSLLPLTQWTYPLPPSSPLSTLFSAVSYEEPLARLLIRKLKYTPFLRDLSLQCAFLIGAHIVETRPDQDFSRFLLVPVPLHKKRLKWRGFNQAEEIAKELSGLLGAELVSNVLFRVRPTKPQVELSEKERIENIKGAFLVKDSALVKNRDILLVDDVSTSGGTMEECARALQGAGASRVFGAVVARG